MINDKNKRIL